MPDIHLKPDWSPCIEYLDVHGVDRLFHFTDRANISSIRQADELVSWKEAQRRSIRISHPGGNNRSRELDVSRGLDDYVRLSFVPYPPMLFALKKDGRLQDPVMLEIDPIVALWQTSLFSTGNAASFKDAVKVGSGFEVLERIRFDLIKARAWSGNEEKLLIQAEVMVHQFLPLEFIKSGI